MIAAPPRRFASERLTMAAGSPERSLKPSPSTIGTPSVSNVPSVAATVWVSRVDLPVGFSTTDTESLRALFQSGDVSARPAEATSGSASIAPQKLVVIRTGNEIPISAGERHQHRLADAVHSKAEVPAAEICPRRREEAASGDEREGEGDLQSEQKLPAARAGANHAASGFLENRLGREGGRLPSRGETQNEGDDEYEGRDERHRADVEARLHSGDRKISKSPARPAAGPSTARRANLARSPTARGWTSRSRTNGRRRSGWLQGRDARRLLSAAANRARAEDWRG